MDRNCNLEEFAGSDDYLLYNCTPNNFENRVQQMVDALETIKSEDTRKYYQIYINEMKKNIGKGFVQLDLSELGRDICLETKEKPEKVLILSDVFCGSSGDQFVEVCKISKKGTVIGRATMGITDYGNVAKKTWNDQFELWYPTSRISKIDRGEGAYWGWCSPRYLYTLDSFLKMLI